MIRIMAIWTKASLLLGRGSRAPCSAHAKRANFRLRVEMLHLFRDDSKDETYTLHGCEQLVGRRCDSISLSLQLSAAVLSHRLRLQLSAPEHYKRVVHWSFRN
jgi:hypothetical protein